MAVISMKQLLEAGVHFGHQTRRWNPKMAQYIFTERNGIYIIDLQKTVRKIDEAYLFIRDVALEGKNVLFVGTKKQAQESIESEAKRCNMFYVYNRWLGGMLTNFRTIRTRIRFGVVPKGPSRFVYGEDTNEEEKKNGSHLYETVTGSGRSLRSSDPSLEPQDGSVHLH